MPSARAASASRSGGIALSRSGICTAMMWRVSPAKLARNAAGILVGHHADDDHQRTRHPLLEIAERRRDDAAAFGIVAAVEPDLAARRRLLHQRARRQPLHPRRPFGVDDAGLERRGVDLERVERAQRRDRKPGIVELMPAEQFWRRQIHQAAIVLIDQPPALDIDVPFLPGAMQRRAHALRLLLDHGHRFGRLLGANHRHVALDDARPFRRRSSSACRREIRCDPC